MLLITERILITGGPLQREDPVPYDDLSRVPNLYAGDVRQSNFLFIFQESDLLLLDDDLKKKISSATAGDLHILDVIKSEGKPKQWKMTTMKFPDSEKGKDKYIRCYLSEAKPVNLIVVTNIPINQIITASLKSQGETIGNHCIKKFFDFLLAFTKQYIEGLDPDLGKIGFPALEILISRFNGYWTQFKLENKDNHFFQSSALDPALEQLNAYEKRVLKELEIKGRKKPWHEKWWADKIILVVITGVVTAIATAIILKYLNLA